MENLLSVVRAKLEEEKELLHTVSKEIWENPELKNDEKLAHDLLTRVLTEKGFQVEKNYILPTAFRAEFKTHDSGPTVAIFCEYDALPEIGHACGHNLIAEAGLAAGLAVKAALEADKNLHGKVVVFGTPAEEGGGGKISLLNAGAFKGIDVALMVHPGPLNLVYPPFLACSQITVKFIGKETHASIEPWQGRNALDAAVAAYNNIALLRQHIKPRCRVHGIITDGGAAPNIIPGHSEILFLCRAETTHDLMDLMERFEACCIGSAKATGCELDINIEKESTYHSLTVNKVLAETYRKYAELLGVTFQDHLIDLPPAGSTDMGNVSEVIPSIHPIFYIGTNSINHSPDFTAASGCLEAQAPTVIASQCLASVALEVMSNPELLEAAKKQFQDDLAAQAF